MKHEVHQVKRKQIDSHKVCSKCPPLARTQVYASVLVIGQLRHQSATAPSIATHATDAGAAHQCHERDSDVIFNHM